MLKYWSVGVWWSLGAQQIIIHNKTFRNCKYNSSCDLFLKFRSELSDSDYFFNYHISVYNLQLYLCNEGVSSFPLHSVNSLTSYQCLAIIGSSTEGTWSPCLEGMRRNISTVTFQETRKQINKKNLQHIAVSFEMLLEDISLVQCKL